MQPHEIKPDTQLATIIGYNAQTGDVRRYFNKILKRQGINATGIALNLNDDNFAFTMQNIAKSKIDKVLLESEFRQAVLPYCDSLNEEAKRTGACDFLEIEAGKIVGYAIATEAEALFVDASKVDEKARFVAKMMIVANRWFDADIDVDTIPLIMGEK